MKTACPYRYILELPTFEYDCLVGLNIKEGTRQRQGETYNVEKLTVSGSSNLKVQHKVLC